MRRACRSVRAATAAYTFFLPPFLPFDMRLFFPTAMLGNRLAAPPVLALQEAEQRDGANLGRRGFCPQPAKFACKLREQLQLCMRQTSTHRVLC